MNKKQTWPTIAILKEDQEIAKAISKYPGVLQHSEMKDVLMIAASIAVESGAPELETPKGDKTDVVHGSLLSGENYNEYRQYMILIYFWTRGREELSNMSDLSDIVNNFVDYVHRGLQIMKDNYLKNGGPEEFEKMFSKAIAKMDKPLLG